MYLIIFSTLASQDKKRLKAAGLEERTKELLDLLAENPFADPPSYKEPAGKLKDLYSRRISIRHRLVYQVDRTPYKRQEEDYDGIVYVKRMWTSHETS